MGDTLVIAVRVVVSLAVVFGVILFLSRRLSKGRTPSSSDSLAVVGRQTVGGKSSVVVVELDGRRFLLGVTEQTISLLHAGDVPQLAPVDEAAPDQLTAIAPSGPVSPASAADPATGETTRDHPSATVFADRLAHALVAVPPLSLASHRAASAARPTPVDLPTVAVNGMLGQSILSLSTWKQAAAALRRTR